MFDLFDSSSGWGRFGNALGNYAMSRSPVASAGYDLYNNTTSPTASKSNSIAMDSQDPGSYKGIVGSIIPAYGLIRKFSEANREKTQNGEDDNPFKSLINGQEDPTEKAGMMASAQQGLIAPAGNMQDFNKSHNSNAGLISSIISLL